ncbi:MAG TPA: ABC transporter substrate-binding protein [Candidatus Micrarchaeia archaeon]|nr:ABC transporter substrate-binding protein [Candidatus Micrarchaeia archaeon]
MIRGLGAIRRPLASLSLLALVLTGCGAVAGKPSHPGARAISGGVVRFAGYVGEGPTFLFPMFTGSYWDVGYVPWFTYQMWRPLYIWGQGGKPVFSARHSLAYTPAWSLSGGDTVATVTLKPWKWSDGRTVTTRDIEFWINMLKAEKTNWPAYVPGHFPDNIKAVRYLSATKFQITFTGTVSHTWLLGNQLSQITPIPQHAWDKTSAHSPIGNYDRTPAGAAKVYTYLIGQTKSVAEYATNPLWKVVDGAWEIKSYQPTNTYVAFKPNPKYSGSSKPKIKEFIEVPFTSDSSEFNALESGQLDYGYVPLNDRGTIPALKAKGYKIINWSQDTWGGIIFSYAPKDPQTPILKQLYVRQAMTHLINMTSILKNIEHGLGYYASGPVPDPGYNSPLVTAYERDDPYPYDVAAAKQLLSSHGWKVVPNGTSTCRRPGTGPTDCGAGVRKGAPLQFTLLAQTATTMNSEMVQLIRSSYSLVGINLILKIVNAGEEISLEGSCIQAKSCPWQLNYSIEFWPWGWPGWYPTGGSPFGCNASGNYSDLCDPHLQQLINATHTSTSFSALASYENYMAKEQYEIFMPMPVFRISAVKKNLDGVAPQDPYLNLYPNDWYYTKK